MRRPITFLSAFALLAGMLVIPASADHGDPVFELDGNVALDHAGNVDWTDFFDANLATKALPAGFIAAGASADHALPDFTTFTQGSKDVLDIDDWTCTRANNVNNKVDITNAYSAAERNEAGDLIIYFGTELKAPEGNSNIGMWFLQDEDAGCEQTGGGSQAFTGNHVVGDVLVVSAFTNGGTQANITVYKWVGSGGSDGALDRVGSFAGATCTGGALGSDLACAIANSVAVPTPWFSPDRKGNDEPLAINTFFEGAVNITQLLGTDPEDECFTQFLANTRSSQSLTATLFDFTTGELEICGGLTIVKETDPEAADQDFDFTISGPGVDESFQLNAADHDEGQGNPASRTYPDLLIGDYTITEVDIPDGWDLTDIACDDGTVGDLEAGDVTVSVGVSAGVTCTFTNRLRHSILIEKTYGVDPGGNLATFALHEDDDGEPGDKVGDLDHTEADGRHFYCIDDLIPGDYWVVEETTPDGFVPNDPVDVTSSSTQRCDQRVDEGGLIDGADGPDETIANEPAAVDLTVRKWKLTLDEDGQLVPSNTPLDGFGYTLYLGEDDEGDVVGTSTTGDGGPGETAFSAGILEVGETYTVCETGTPGDYWTGADCQTFVAALDTDVELDFYNEPLSRVQVLFFDETGFTNATVTCEDLGVELTGDDLDDTGATTALELDQLPLGDYDCTIEIRNGGSGGD